MRDERSTQEMLEAILDARRSLYRALQRSVNCPQRMREWTQQDVAWCEALLDNLAREMAMRDDAHVIETTLRYLLAENASDDA